MKKIIIFLLSIWCIAAQAKPNIVIFILDDVGQRDISIYGQGAPSTPNIDQLALQGVYFDNAWVATSSCSASRASLLTGRYPSQTGAPNLHDPLPATQTTLAQTLGQAGYYRAALGKWHLGDEVVAHFDKVEDLDDSTGAGNWYDTLSQRPKDQPFFFWLGLRDGHAPYDAWYPPLKRLSVDGRVVRPWLVGLRNERLEQRDYFHEVARADQVIGQFVAQLQQQQLLDNTIVVLLSDNGPEQRAKTLLYDRGLLTPLIIRYPLKTDKYLGQRRNTFVSAVDIAPTVLQLAGLPVPDTMQGIAIPELTDNKVQRQWLFAERHNHAGPAYERALRTTTHIYKRNLLNQPVCSPLKYALRSLTPKTDYYGAEELYRLADDPFQRNNRLNDPQEAEVLAQLRATMNAQLRKNNEDARPLVFKRCEEYFQISLNDLLRDLN